MKLFDIYKHKSNGNIIQIESFATHMNRYSVNEEMIVIFSNIEKHGEYEIGSSPASNGYGTQEEIEDEYDLLVPEEYLFKYKDWNEIFNLTKVDNSDILISRRINNEKYDNLFNELLKDISSEAFNKEKNN